MFCAGLTGGVGAGKSAAAEMFAARGVLVVDADTVGRDLTAAGGAGVAAAIAALGEWAAAADGGLNRQLVRERVFFRPGLAAEVGGGPASADSRGIAAAPGGDGERPVWNAVRAAAF